MSESSRVFTQYSKPDIVGAGITFTILPMIVVGLRFYARRFSRTPVGIDDWSIVVALVLCTASGVVEILAAEIGGLGSHQPQGPHGELLHTQTLTNYEKCRYINLIITSLNLGIVKISILLFYRRLFIVKPFRVASGVMIAFVASWAIAFTSAMAAQCHPPTYFWESFEIDYVPQCLNVQVLYQALAISDIILDVLVLALPIPMVASLQLPWKTKIRVIDILMLGSVVLGSGIARVTSFYQVVHFTNHHAQVYFRDTLWYTAGPLFWIFAENAVAIIGACLPTLAPLWTQKQWQKSRIASYLKGLRKSSTSGSYDDLEGPYQDKTGAEDASSRHLVGLGTATNILSEDIPLRDRPQEGIEVRTTLSSDATTKGNLARKH